MIPADSPLLLALSPYDQSDVLTTMTVTYHFHAPGFELDEGASLEWTDPLKQLVRDGFAYISTLINLEFVESDSPDNVTMTFTHVADLGDSAGYVQSKGNGVSLLAFGTQYLFPIADNSDNTTVLHEIGHALGLSHPHDGPFNLPGVTSDSDLGEFTLNTELVTRMSYNPGKLDGFPDLDIRGEGTTFGALDIAALHLLYDANTGTGLGDTVYGIGREQVTIWDNGGFDIIDFSGAVDPTTINLTAASLLLESGGGGNLSYIKSNGNTLADGGYTIAFGVEIEAARGGSARDEIFGNDLANSLYGNGGDDQFVGGGGDDRIEGGAGEDVSVYDGAQRHFTLTLSAQGTTLLDRTGAAGTDTLVDVEQLLFEGLDGSAFDLGIRSGAAGLSATDFEAIAELYIAYFDRAPASKGLLYWATRLADGMGLPEIANSFFVQPETQRTYAEFLDEAGNVADSRALVNSVFQNVLGRAPTSDYWVNELDRADSGITPGIFILAVLNGAKAVTGGAADRAHLAAKADIGVYFSAIKGLSEYDDTVSVMNIFDGSADSVTRAVAEIDRIYDAALDPTDGQFLMPLVGVIDNPFAVA